jgi:hypothetical protein
MFLFRPIFGIYLLFHFYQLIPYAEELFGNEMPYNPSLSPLSATPNILNYIDATYFLLFANIMSIIFILKLWPRATSFILWFIWMTLFNRNFLISNPGPPYVGWILLALSISSKDKTNNRIFWAAWLLMATGYTVSGIHKYMCSPSWSSFMALEYVLENPLARNNILRNMLLEYPIVLKASTAMSLFLEISFLPFGIFYRTRAIYWVLFLFLHLGIIMVVNFTDLTLGVLMIHLFTFSRR